MKLLAQTNRHYLLISLLALAVSSVALFLGVRALFEEFADERLEQLQQEITAYAQTHDTLPVYFQSTGARLTVRPAAVYLFQAFADTVLLNEIEQEQEPYRRLRFGLQLQGRLYQVDLLQSALETEDIAETVLLLHLALMAAMFAALFWAQKGLSERLWAPFYHTLDRLRTFRLAQQEPLAFAATETDEFAELNATLERLTEKTRQDYDALKRFTENASHEIQTPLAVIHAKLDTLFQSDNLSDVQLAHLHSTQQAAARLSRLQQNLLLLVKIGNDQFQVQEPLDWKQLVESKLALLEDFIVAKNLHIRTQLQSVPILFNRFLAEMLVSNLVGNAVKHNLPDGGWLSVQLNEKQLVVTNSAATPIGPPAALVERFRRSDPQSDGLGLGLAIVREICEQAGWMLEVGFEEGAWKASVQFYGVVDR